MEIENKPTNSSSNTKDTPQKLIDLSQKKF